MSDPTELAKQYLDAYFGKLPFDTLAAILADDLAFEGPFHTSSTAKDYLDALRGKLPPNAGYQLEDVYCNDESVCLMYMFSKPGIRVRMVQSFKFRDGKICDIKLVFDTGAFTR